MNNKLILFVHGLGGGRAGIFENFISHFRSKDPQGTWGDFEKLILADSELNYDVKFFDYNSALFRIPILQKKYAPIHGLANQLKTTISLDCDKYTEIVLVGHSLGGIVIRQYLTDEIIAKKKLKTSKVIFYATPHEGALLAKISSTFSVAHRHLNQLCHDSSYLDYLNDQWFSAKVHEACEYYNIVAGEDSIVTPQSAKANFRHSGFTEIPNKGHLSVSKPNSPEDHAFKALKKFITTSQKITLNRPIGTLTFSEWSEHLKKNAYLECTEREEQIETIKKALSQPSGAIRLIGLSGLGKTRLVFEVIKAMSESKQQQTLYADLSEANHNLVSISTEWAHSDVEGILVLDNCTPEKHTTFVSNLRPAQKKIFLITIDSDLRETNDCNLIHLKPLKQNAIKSILKKEFPESFSDVDVANLAKHSSGFPQMALMLAKSWLEGDPEAGALADDVIAEKLLWGNVIKKNDDHEKLLTCCSLFNWFGYAEAPKQDAEHIAEIASKNYDELYQCLNRFKKRGIVDFRGRFAQVVPKPLAVRLAALWWQETSPEKQRTLVENLPDNLVESFCEQLSSLHFLPNAREIANELCEKTGPFGHADVVLTPKGIRLIRAIAYLAPRTITNTLYQMFKDLSDEQVKKIDYALRIHLLSALETLCYDKESFIEAAKIMQRLALTEKEAWANNSTEKFAQLFHIHLSGTQMPLQGRLPLIVQIGVSSSPPECHLALKAIETGLTIKHFTRIRPVDQQLPVQNEDWVPESYEEIADYFSALIDQLITISTRSDMVEKCKKVLCHRTRELIEAGLFDLVEYAAEKIVPRECYWPEMSSTLNDCLKYISSQDLETIRTSLLTLQNKYAPKDIRTKIHNIVCLYSHDIVVEEQESGEPKYIDQNQIRAEKLGVELAQDVSVLKDHLDLLLKDDLTNLHAFATSFASQTVQHVEVIDAALNLASQLSNPNLSFVQYMFAGLYKVSREAWEMKLIELSRNPELLDYYPMFLRSGFITLNCFEELQRVMREEQLDTEKTFWQLSTGTPFKDIDQAVLAEFLSSELAKNINNAEPILHILYSFALDNTIVLHKLAAVRDRSLLLLPEIPIKNGLTLYRWKVMLTAIIPASNDKFIEMLLSSIATMAQKDSCLSGHSNEVQQVLTLLFQQKGIMAWDGLYKELAPIEGLKRFRLERLLLGINMNENNSSLLSVIDCNELVAWAKEQDNELVLRAKTLAMGTNVFEQIDDKLCISKLCASLLFNFVSLEDVTTTVSAKIHSISFSGSAVPIYKNRHDALSVLLTSSNPNLVEWARNEVQYFKKMISREQVRDEERSVGIF